MRRCRPSRRGRHTGARVRWRKRKECTRARCNKTEQVKRWLKRHPRFKVHFIPTSSSWLNMVERWFAEITGKAVRRGSFSSVPDLIAAIEEFIEEWNRDPKPFIWTARAEDILEKIERCRRRLEEIKPGCTVRRGRKKAA